jgi:4'-phosphopantetheinyl transferase
MRYSIVMVDLHIVPRETVLRLSGMAGALVFSVRVDAVAREALDGYLAWLTPEERDKHARMATLRLRDEYIVTRALSRWVLSRLEPSVAPAEWQFERTDAGRPFVVGPRPAPAYTNLSNAGGLVLCAVSEHPVGVDVEPLSRGADLLPAAAKMFAPAENAAMLALPEEERARRAVELWTTKEAYLKGRGEGISVRPSRFDVEALGGGRFRLGDVGVLGDDPSAWQIVVGELSGEAEPCVWALAIRRGQAPDLAIEVTSVLPA